MAASSSSCSFSLPGGGAVFDSGNESGREGDAVINQVVRAAVVGALDERGGIIE